MRERVAHQIGHGHGPALKRDGLGIIQQFGQHRFQPLGLRAGEAEMLGGDGIGGAFGFQNPQIHLDGRERVADFVHDAGRQFADGREPLGLHELLLRFAQALHHAVEARAQFAQFIVQADGHGGIQLAARNIKTRGGKLADGEADGAREPRHHHHHGGHREQRDEDRVATQPRERLKGLVRVHLGNQAPFLLGQIDPRAEHRLAFKTGIDAGAAVSRERQADAFGVHRVRERPRMVHEARGREHDLAVVHQIRLPRVPKAGGIENDRVQSLRERQRADEYAARLTVRAAHRPGHEHTRPGDGIEKNRTGDRLHAGQRLLKQRRAARDRRCDGSHPPC